jgi:hypothetical protein
MIIYVLTIAADTGIWHAVSQPKQTESVRDCRPKLLNSTWGYTVISTEGIPVNRLLFLFFLYPSYGRGTPEIEKTIIIYGKVQT